MGSKEAPFTELPLKIQSDPMESMHRHEYENLLPDGFEDYYREQFGPRWPQLLSSLLEPSTRVDRLNAFFEPIPTPPAKFMDASWSTMPGVRHAFRLAQALHDPRRDARGLLETYRMDPASMIAASALEVQPGDRVLDMCAAPGGKSLLLAEAMGDAGRLVANELSPTRRAKLKTILQDYLPGEQRKHIQVTGHDATRWGLHEPDHYDRVLLDAPCSSERHVLGKEKERARWKPGRSKQLSRRQYALLCAALGACKSGGRIVYATCALSKLENDGVVERLLKRKGDQCVKWQTTFPEPFVEATEHGWRILPDRSDGWGPMYWSILQKRTGGML